MSKPDARYTSTIIARVSEAAQASVRAAAERSGLRVSDWVRYALHRQAGLLGPSGDDTSPTCSQCGTGPLAPGDWLTVPGEFTGESPHTVCDTCLTYER